MSISTYTKLWSDILDSTVWREDNSTRILWITMLAMADTCGHVVASIPGLADRARITVDEVLSGLEKLASPDPYSQTKTHEGRRIREVERGWLILNYEKHRERADVEDRRAQNREAQQRWRDRRRGATRAVSNSKQSSASVSKDNGPSAPTATSTATSTEEEW